MVAANLTRALQEQGLKLTRSRMAVLQVLTETKEHLKVAEVHRRALQIADRIGLASVYRTMELLARLNLVKHVHVDHRHRHYARTTERHCHHILCRTCGVAVEFSDCQAEALVKVLARRTKFRIEGHCMDFFGQCPACLGRSVGAPQRTPQRGRERSAVSPAPKPVPRPRKPHA